jgi:anti-sigma regulatory factor (Ser/Thr protein kinase)
MEDKIEIKIPASPKYLKLIRRTVLNISEIAGFSSTQCNHITLAIDEACTNIIRHAYGGNSTKPIILQIFLLKDRLRFILKDYGKKAQIEAFQSRQLDDLRPGGLGVHLIKSVMDTFELINRTRGNMLVLEKFLDNSKEADLADNEKS